jgi:putative ubiquitin-RnfH superfamily antitoxin RatB of RatAB toxin-antitoxin module
MAELLHITVCYSPQARVVHTLALQLPQGACVRDALALCEADSRFASALGADLGGTKQAPLFCAVWGTRVPRNQPLQPNDRTVLCRPLRVDPKVARRERFAQQGARTTGLFAARRPGAKPGY